MPRKGWTQVEVPHGWTQLIRSVQPKSEKWPRAERKQLAVPARQWVPPKRGRWRQPLPFPRVDPDTSMQEARQRVSQLEAPLAVFGDTRSPEVTMLQESLKLAQRAVQERPVGVQLAQCEQFVVRAQKRLDSLDEERAKLVSELEEGQARLQRLRVGASQKPQEPNATAPAPPPHWAAELQRLQSLVAQMQQERIQLGAQQERIQLGPRQVEEELQDVRWEVDALRHERDSLVAERGGSVVQDTTMVVVGLNSTCSDRMAALIEEGELKRRRMEATRISG